MKLEVGDIAPLPLLIKMSYLPSFIFVFIQFRNFLCNINLLTFLRPLFFK